MWISTPDDKLINLERVSSIEFTDDNTSLTFYIDGSIVIVDVGNLVDANFMKLVDTSDRREAKKLMLRVYYAKLAELLKAKVVKFEEVIDNVDSNAGL